MMKKNKKIPIPPNVSKNYREIIAEEALALLSFVRHNWYFVLPVVFAFIVIVYLVRPLPPKTIRLATGQPNSTFQVIGEHYKEYFKRQNVELELVESSGALENNRLLEEGQVDVIFSQGGLKIYDPREEIRSLGSISYQPLWLFYKGKHVLPETKLADFLRNRRTSINVVGSGTRILSETILKLHNLDPDDLTFESFTTQQSIAAMKSGEIDAMFLVAGVESKNLQELILSPGVQIFNFDLADAYAKRLRYLTQVTVPKGSVHFDPVSPPFDVNMVASTVTLLSTEDLHPAIQLLFLEAASEYDQTRLAVFNGEVTFPAYTDKAVQQSQVAARFYKNGTPFLWDRAPYWVASLFDEIWFYLLALGAILIPIIGFLPSYRKSHSESSIEECYTELRHIESQLLEANDKHTIASLEAQLGQLKYRVWRLWVPSGNRPAYYDLRGAVIAVEADLAVKQSVSGAQG
jgi:TRAP-type uncharacterized transport system substrate-binding protein